MHILIGAFAGAVWAVALRATFLAASGNGFELKDLALAAMGGAVGGALCAATLGAAGIVGATGVRQVVAFSGGGASGATTEQVVENAVHDRPLHEGVATAAPLGAVAGLATLGLERGVGKLVALRLRRGLHTGPPPKLPVRILTAPAPSPGHGARVALQDEEAAPNRWGRSLREYYAAHQTAVSKRRELRQARRNDRQARRELKLLKKYQWRRGKLDREPQQLNGPKTPASSPLSGPPQPGLITNLKF